jgi:signal transduction histidine kinase
MWSKRATDPGSTWRSLPRTYGLRLSLVYVAIFAVATAVLVGLVYAYAVRALERESDDVIEAELQGLVEQYRAGGIDALHAVIDERARSRNSSGDVYLLVDPQLQPIAGNVAAWPGASSTANRRWVEFDVSVLVGSEFRTRKVRAGVFTLPGGDRLLVGTDIHERQAFVSRMGWTLLLSLLAVTAIGALLGAWMNRHVLRRVDAISAAGREIVEGNFSQRLPRSGSGDEFDTLAGNLNEMLERVERLTQALRFVIDATAHDLRGPLNRLRARIEAGLRSNDDATRELALSDSLRDAEALEQTIAALLRIAQAQAGEAAAEVAAIDLGQLARDVVELYEPLALDRHVDLHVLAEPPATLRGSRQLLAHALANLVDNALKFTPAGGRVDVRVVHRDGGLELSVADTGPGIAAGDRARALERGARLASAEGTPGSGLGLSLVEAVARMHHATLALEDNAPGLRVVLRFGSG